MGESLADNSVNVLVVEDELEIRELMALHLLRQGYRVTECGSAEDALQELSKNSFHLVVLDWMLPGLSGVDILGSIKKSATPPSVLMVTAKTEPQDIVAGLEKGADDYMTKPFNPQIFLARVKALIRRTVKAPSEDSKDISEISGLKVNFKTYEISFKDSPLHLTPSEFKLLGALIQSDGRVLTREQLIENIQGEGINVIGRTIDTHVFGLRKKLGDWGDNIETIRGVGYRVKTE
ncbi:Phosphate regulon transcriptional regulatory protein PhoB [compost metagenome]